MEKPWRDLENEDKEEVGQDNEVGVEDQIQALIGGTHATLHSMGRELERLQGVCALLLARLPSAVEQQHLGDQLSAEHSDEAAAKREREARGLTAYAMRHLRELQEQALLSAAVLASVVIDRVSADGSVKNGGFLCLGSGDSTSGLSLHVDDVRRGQEQTVQEQWTQLRQAELRNHVLQRENGFLRQTIQRYQAQLCIVDRKAQSLEGLNARKREEHVEERLQLQMQVQDLQEKLLAHLPLPHSRKRPEASSEVQVEVEKRKDMEGKYLKARDELHYHKQEWGRQVQELRQENVLQMSLLKRRHAQELQQKQAQCDALRAECEHLKKELHLVSQEQEHSKRRANVEKLRRPSTALAQFTLSPAPSPLPSPIRPATHSASSASGGHSASASASAPFTPHTSPLRRGAAQQRRPRPIAYAGGDKETAEVDHTFDDENDDDGQHQEEEASEWGRGVQQGATPARPPPVETAAHMRPHRPAQQQADQFEKDMTFSFIDDADMSEDMFALSRELSFATTPTATNTYNTYDDDDDDTAPSRTVRRRILNE